jgi:hypothetical protein
LKAHKSLPLVLLSVVATTLILVSAMSFGPAVISSLLPQAALAEDLPPDATSTDIQATGTLHALAVPPAAFSPRYSGQYYLNFNSSLSVSSGGGAFSAPVYLPQGAKVVKLVVFVRDNSGSTITAYLGRCFPTQDADQLMANVQSADSAEEQKLVDDTIYHPIINNDSYAYLLSVGMNGPDVALNTIKIVYYY